MIFKGKTALVVATVSVLVLSCTKKDDKEETKETKPAIEDTTSNISTVKEKMVPGSLILDTNSTGFNLTEGPCGDDTFFACQPTMLKLYLDMGKQMVDMANQIVTSIGTEIGNLPGSSGTVDTGDGATISYNITSEAEYKLLVSTATGPFLYLDVADNVYKIKFDGANAEEDEDDEGGPAKVETTITYTDENNFKVDLMLAGMECSDDDVQAPQSIAVNITYTDGVAQGKAMMFHPRFLGESLTCDTEPTDATKMFLYTDFVGDDTNTTAAIYMMDNSVADADSFSDYDLADFCTNFDGCQNGAAFGEQEPIANKYKNNFCATKDDVTWNTNCESSSSLISTPTFSDKSLWTVPADFEDRDITMPSSL